MPKDIFSLDGPIVKKCCCLPAVNGLLVLAYSNLVISLLTIPVIGFIILLQYNYPKESVSLGPEIEEFVTLAFLIIDVFQTTVLLVGAHRRNVLLLKISLFSGIIYAAVSLCFDVITFADVHYLCIIFYTISYILYLYMLFLLYNTIYIIKGRQQVQYHPYDESDIL